MWRGGRTAHLHQVVDDDDVPPDGDALLDADDAPVAIAHLDAEGDGSASTVSRNARSLKAYWRMSLTFVQMISG